MHFAEAFRQAQSDRSDTLAVESLRVGPSRRSVAQDDRRGKNAAPAANRCAGPSLRQPPLRMMGGSRPCLMVLPAPPRFISRVSREHRTGKVISWCFDFEPQRPSVVRGRTNNHRSATLFCHPERGCRSEGPTRSDSNARHRRAFALSLAKGLRAADSSARHRRAFALRPAKGLRAADSSARHRRAFALRPAKGLRAADFSLGIAKRSP